MTSLKRAEKYVPAKGCHSLCMDDPGTRNFLVAMRRRE